eukprot:3135295-Amphidinium_carterae.1
MAFRFHNSSSPPYPPDSRFTSSVKRIGLPQLTATYYATINRYAQRSPRTTLVMLADLNASGSEKTVIRTETWPISIAMPHIDCYLAVKYAQKQVINDFRFIVNSILLHRVIDQFSTTNHIIAAVLGPQPMG